MDKNIQKKICSRCNIEKTILEFFSEKNNKKDGKRNICKICDKRCREKNIKENRDIMRAKERLKYLNMSDFERSEYIKKKSQQNIKRYRTAKEIGSKRKYEKTDKGIFHRYKNDAKRRGRHYEFKLTLEQFSSVINKNCYYCGFENCRGVDRFDNTIGYTIENSVPCCGRCNAMKSDASYIDWIQHMKNIINKTGKICI